MAFLGLRTQDAGLGGGSVADVLIKALTGDPEREMALARGRSDLELDAYRQKQMEAAAAKYQAEADTEAAILNQNRAAGGAAGDYYAGALPAPVDPDPAYTVGEPLPVSVDQTPTMADLYRGHPEEPVPVYLQGTDETDIVPYADQMANYDRQRAYEQERAKAVFMGGGNAAQVAQGANLLEGGFTQANETNPDALRRNMPLLGINPTDQTVLGEDDLAGTKARIAVEAAKSGGPDNYGPVITGEQAATLGLDPDGQYQKNAKTGRWELVAQPRADEDHFGPVITGEEAAAQGMDPTKSFQQNTKTGKWDQVGGGGINVAVGDKLTESLAKDTVFYPGARNAEMELEDTDTVLSSRVEKTVDQLIPGNWFQTPEYQKARIALDSWIQNVLRKESGATIPTDEMENYRQTYGPQPGDDIRTIEYKRQLRADRTKSMRYGLEAGAPETLKKIDEEFDRRRAARGQPAATAPDAAAAAPTAGAPDVDAILKNLGVE